MQTDHKNTLSKKNYTARALLVAAALIPLLLIVTPSFGLTLFWNAVIPVAPALLVIAPGLWRNVCPLAVAANLPAERKHGGGRPNPERLAAFNLAAVAALLLIVPLRHALFDTNAAATLLLLAVLVLAALAIGLFWGGRSGWCAGLCPLYPVEKLYGSANTMTFQNGRCSGCSRCTVPCPDTVRNARPFPLKHRFHALAGTLMIGGFPGFIWGWFQVPDGIEISGMETLFTLYAAPFSGLAVTAALYGLLYRLEPMTRIRLFAAAAVASYYAFRIPNLLGFGRFPGDGMLIDLSQLLPLWSVAAAVAAESLFFFWWFLRRGAGTVRPWLTRPGKSGTC